MTLQIAAALLHQKLFFLIHSSPNYLLLFNSRCHFFPFFFSSVKTLWWGRRRRYSGIGQPINRDSDGSHGPAVGSADPTRPHLGQSLVPLKMSISMCGNKYLSHLSSLKYLTIFFSLLTSPNNFS